jgi:hypothetical protein
VEVVEDLLVLGLTAAMGVLLWLLYEACRRV